MRGFGKSPPSPGRRMVGELIPCNFADCSLIRRNLRTRNEELETVVSWGALELANGRNREEVEAELLCALAGEAAKLRASCPRCAPDERQLCADCTSEIAALREEVDRG